MISEALASKAAAPLDPVTLSEQARAAIAAYDAFRARAADLSNQLQRANRTVAVIKEQAGGRQRCRKASGRASPPGH